MLRFVEVAAWTFSVIGRPFLDQEGKCTMRQGFTYRCAVWGESLFQNLSSPRETV